MSETFECMHLTARKMIFNANYEEKLTESVQNKRNWVPGDFDIIQASATRREMSKNVEKCREMSKSLIGGGPKITLHNQ